MFIPLGGIFNRPGVDKVLELEIGDWRLRDVRSRVTIESQRLVGHSVGRMTQLKDNYHRLVIANYLRGSSIYPGLIEIVRVGITHIGCYLVVISFFVEVSKGISK